MLVPTAVKAVVSAPIADKYVLKVPAATVIALYCAAIAVGSTPGAYVRTSDILVAVLAVEVAGSIVWPLESVKLTSGIPEEDTGLGVVE